MTKEPAAGWLHTKCPEHVWSQPCHDPDCRCRTCLRCGYSTHEYEDQKIETNGDVYDGPR